MDECTCLEHRKQRANAAELKLRRYRSLDTGTDLNPNTGEPKETKKASSAISAADLSAPEKAEQQVQARDSTGNGPPRQSKRGTLQLAETAWMIRPRALSRR